MESWFSISGKTELLASVYLILEPNFMPAYLSALSGIPIEQGYIKPQKKEPQTLRWFISQYRKSAHWASLTLNSRKRLDLYFDQIIKKSGDFYYKKLTSKHIL
ncbi:phage-related integrase/recombinase [Candidatus Liberibacter solanacearum CLso-ZC1]|uniref:Phage-related integrase/recombinase n=1 Tax=Liberibacter solanacearum (strain CLso-ZC1) TaxID=658172 RepID=E4UCB2_LIBSC|nr:phage-related integrase/recombinase [Candidatus Liberibacter solanacearum CLso-ZC1]